MSAPLCSPPCARAAQAEQRLADRTRALELEVRELRAALALARGAAEPDGCPTCGRPWPRTARDAVLALHAEGLELADIAAQLELTERRVQQVLAEAGAARPRGRPRHLPPCPSKPASSDPPPTTS